VTNFYLQFFNPTKDGTQNGGQKLLQFQTSQVLAEPDTRKMSLGRRKWKRPRTWALFASIAHAVTVETGAVSKRHSPPHPPPKKGAKSKKYVEGLLACGLMRSTGWTDEVRSVQIADFSCWAADSVKRVSYLLGSADCQQMQTRAKQQAAEWDVMLPHVAVLRSDSTAADKAN
jgi:hypothetical protein